MKCSREKYLSLLGRRKCALRDRPTRKVSCRSKVNSSPLCGPATTVRRMRMAAKPCERWTLYVIMAKEVKIGKGSFGERRAVRPTCACRFHVGLTLAY